LADAFGGEGIKVLVLVDELDRCRPSYAVEYLETIKHIFDIRGIAFVLAVDKNHLESSAKALFGAGLNFPEYYRKFAHRNIELPQPSDQGIDRLIRYYAETVIEIAGENFQRFTLLKIRDRVRDIAEITMVLKATPRQIREMCRLIGHLLSGSEQDRGKIFWSLGVGSVLMATLAVVKPDLYRRLGTGTAGTEDFRELFGRFPEGKAEWLAQLVLTGYGSENADAFKKLVSDFIQIGALPEGFETERNHRLDQYFQGWGHATDAGLKRIYEALEELRSFATR
jgi:hypothetical protein